MLLSTFILARFLHFSYCEWGILVNFLFCEVIDLVYCNNSIIFTHRYNYFTLKFNL